VTGPATRYAVAADAGPLLRLMRELAVFEGYADQFRVTERDLIERGLGNRRPKGRRFLVDRLAGEERRLRLVRSRSPRGARLSPGPAAQLTAIVTDGAVGELAGYAVVYEIPFTYDLRPTLVLKELFVVATARSLGLGGVLMTAVLAHARARGCARLQWDVLPDNLRAQAFYRRFGGRPDVAWQRWCLSPDEPRDA